MVERPSPVMGGVYCPSCEARVEPAAKFCLACGHDLTGQGPITATGHDLNQLKDIIRQREELSMAEKFDMIAKVEEGANPIILGIAAPADGEAVDIGDAFAAAEAESSGSVFTDYEFGESLAAKAAVRAVVKSTNAWDLIQEGKLDLSEGLFRDAMVQGMEASTHIHDVASGEHEGIDPDAMRAIPVLKPPKRSFCPKCGSDIHANTMLQWRKWRDSSGDVVSMQLEASMQTALIQVASHYLNVMNALQKERDLAYKEAKSNTGVDEDELREEIEAELREEIEAEIRAELAKESKGSKTVSAPKKTQAKKQSSAAKAASGGKKIGGGGLFGGGKKPKKTYAGPKKDKAEWFLKEALDTVYDPHGTGKVLKPKTILARSSEGNVRVEDLIKAYAKKGEKGISELAQTAPITKYLIEAFDAC